MNPSFQRQHLAMLLKYSGISFISGAVNHGFFSGQRSLWTAAVGIVLFVAGAWMEHRFGDSQPSQPAQGSLARTLLWGALLSIGLGFFTGGLQHFQDSPQRSGWVVPLGFVMSVAALLMIEGHRLRGGLLAYAVAGTVVVSATSVAAWQWLERNPQWSSVGHGHGHSHGAESNEPVAQVVTRSVEVMMDDAMRYTPSTIEARAGETLRIVARNVGQVEHELVIGTEAQIKEHAQEMKAQGGAHHAHGGAAISVAPGRTGELVVTFREAATLQMACLLPGHYEAGMRGAVVVAAAGPAAAESQGTATKPTAKPAAKPPHDHSTHKH